ncbi:MAG TPA: TetR/AcrR family transcriptional regulator [Candidatus Limnocylindria bacterium]|nr:TetR/AcrR family transcriptional regulator [Candidatus Limnocylindria bacterium]
MKRRVQFLALLLTLTFFAAANGEVFAQTADPEKSNNAGSQSRSFSFAVSGDSRNCGDVVMPAIAARVKQSGASFYWHLGDFRAIYNFDEDIQHQPEHLARPIVISDYEQLAWDDFLQNQIAPFGRLMVFLGIGNHETIPPKTRDQYIIQFADWLEQQPLRKQRLLDDSNDHKLRTYYHWTVAGVDFINLDNATEDQFDSNQLTWFEKILQADSSKPQIKTVVVGMHEALPESISKGHSMNQSAAGSESGRRVYADLLKAQNDAHKHVYVLASHSHYFMDGIFDTDYWRANGGVLPGWIVGTAGAVRYALPSDSSNARAAETNVYGFLLGTANPDGEISLAFQHVNEPDVPASVVERYKSEFVHWCFDKNSQAK